MDVPFSRRQVTPKVNRDNPVSVVNLGGLTC